MNEESRSYTCIAMPRYSGKTASVISQALDHGGAILVNRESTKQRILDTAKIMGVEAPKIIVAEPQPKNLQGITLAGVIVDIDIEQEH